MYVNYGKKGKELYDLSGGQCVDWQVGDPGDPCMMNNIVKQNPSLQKELQQELTYDWKYGSY